MKNRTRASSALFGGALPPAGDSHAAAFRLMDQFHEAFPAAVDWHARLNAHGYSVARNPRHELRRRRDALYALMSQRAQCYPIIAQTRRLLISD